jgi:hypothetical protein
MNNKPSVGFVEGKQGKYTIQPIKSLRNDSERSEGYSSIITRGRSDKMDRCNIKIYEVWSQNRETGIRTREIIPACSAAAAQNIASNESNIVYLVQLV